MYMCNNLLALLELHVCLHFWLVSDRCMYSMCVLSQICKPSQEKCCKVPHQILKMEFVLTLQPTDFEVDIMKKLFQYENFQFTCSFLLPLQLDRKQEALKIHKLMNNGSERWSIPFSLHWFFQQWVANMQRGNCHLQMSCPLFCLQINWSSIIHLLCFGFVPRLHSHFSVLQYSAFTVPAPTYSRPCFKILTKRVHHRRTVYTYIDISLDSNIEIIYLLYFSFAIFTLMKAATLLPKRQHLYNKLFLCRNPGIYRYTCFKSSSSCWPCNFWTTLPCLTQCDILYYLIVVVVHSNKAPYTYSCALIMCCFTCCLSCCLSCCCSLAVYLYRLVRHHYIIVQWMVIWTHANSCWLQKHMLILSIR